MIFGLISFHLILLPINSEPATFQSRCALFSAPTKVYGATVTRQETGPEPRKSALHASHKHHIPWKTSASPSEVMRGFLEWNFPAVCSHSYLLAVWKPAGSAAAAAAEDQATLPHPRKYQLMNTLKSFHFNPVVTSTTTFLCWYINWLQV